MEDEKPPMLVVKQPTRDVRISRAGNALVTKKNSARKSAVAKKTSAKKTPAKKILAKKSPAKKAAR